MCVLLGPQLMEMELLRRRGSVQRATLKCDVPAVWLVYWVPRYPSPLVGV